MTMAGVDDELGDPVCWLSQLCPECGHALSVKRKCGTCGAVAEGSPKFCGECGTPYVSA